MKRILITGGCGFIGSHTALLLIQKGYEIVIIDSNIRSSEAVIQNIYSAMEKNNIYDLARLKFYKGDLRDIKFLEKVFINSQKIDAVIHFAGMKSVAESIDFSIDYWDVNVAGTVHLLRVMNKFQCNKIVYSSSASVYGNSGEVPFKEDSDLKPLNPYSNTKYVAELFLNDTYKSNPNYWNIINLRYFNPIGANSNSFLGEDINFSENILPRLFKTYSRQDSTFHIFGNDWPTPDGTCIRDYIHIDDLALGHIAALEKLFEEKMNLYCFNLGTGNGTSVLDLIRMFAETNKIKIDYDFVQRREGDVPILVADISSAMQSLSWSPTKSLEDMCRDGFKWFLNFQ